MLVQPEQGCALTGTDEAQSGGDVQTHNVSASVFLMGIKKVSADVVSKSMLEGD